MSGCTCATYDGNGRYDCSVGGKCLYIIPDSKRCAEEYGEGPDAPDPKEDVQNE